MSSSKKRKHVQNEADFLQNIAKLPIPQQQAILAKRAAKRQKKQTLQATKTTFRTQRAKREDDSFQSIQYEMHNNLRHVVPYIHRYETCAKRRWVGRTIFQLFSSEFQRSAPVSYFSQAIQAGLIRVNNAAVTKEYLIKDGDVILHISHRHEPPVSTRMPRIIQTTNDYVVVNKPAGIVCHPSGAYAANSLTRIMQRELSVGPLFVCHRLDRLTSGLIVIARSSKAAGSFGELMKSGSMRKEYLAKVKKIDLAAAVVPDWATLTLISPGVYQLDAPIRTENPVVGSMCCAPDGKEASTQFEILESISVKGGDNNSDGAMIVRAKLLHGRTHQIRLHCAMLKMWIMNDPCYGPPEYVQKYKQKYGEKKEEYDPISSIHLEHGGGNDGEVDGGSGDGKGGEDGTDEGGTAKKEDGIEMTEEETAMSICSYCRRGNKAFNAIQLRHEGIWLHSFRYSMKDGENNFSYETKLPDWVPQDIKL